jgi:hypothetical protein
MINHVYIERPQRQRLCLENQSVLRVCQARGIPYDFFTIKQIHRRSLSLTPQSLVVGYLPTVTSALKQLHIPIPEPIDYPQCLRYLLHRRVWHSTVRDVRQQLCDEGTLQPFFAKPYGKIKRFTGHLMRTHADLHYLQAAPETMRVWCAEPVKWRSEFRAYVANHRLLELLHYDGDATVRPDEAVVLNAIRILSESSESRAGYGMDVGVLDTGITALVECNDGYSLGSYGLSDEHYFEIVCARWCELVGTMTP